MKGYEKWAEEDALKHDSHGDIEPLMLSLADVAKIKEQAFIRGFKRGRLHAAGLVESFNNPKFSGIPTLIRAIGEAKTEDMEREEV